MNAIRDDMQSSNAKTAAKHFFSITWKLYR